jgi:hypothetical protein
LSQLRVHPREQSDQQAVEAFLEGGTGSALIAAVAHG